MTPVCWIIAGPNGSGKTTFAKDFLPEVAGVTNFINADLIAAGLSPFAPEKQLLKASRIFLQQLSACIEAEESFSFETTLSGRTYLKLIKQLQQRGWRVELIYLALPSVELSCQRVAERVKHGGHGIPQQDILRRFPKSLKHLLQEYSSLVDHCVCIMNQGGIPELVFENTKSDRIVHNQRMLDKLISEAKQ
ncbi:MAG: zeta toxin family protein [Bacterioplanes sp.]|nr:zeta toxin family protein [Bacterioplanes sp.]